MQKKLKSNASTLRSEGWKKVENMKDVKMRTLKWGILKNWQVINLSNCVADLELGNQEDYFVSLLTTFEERMIL